MSVRLRIATFNLENFDDVPPGERPSLAERVALMRPQLARLDADVLCLQEVHSQADPGGPRLNALDALLAGTQYAAFNRVATADPRPPQAAPVVWERPLLAVQLEVAGRPLHVVCLHLKSKIPTDVAGQKLDQFTWKSAAGFAEGAFLSSMKRLGQALQLRRFVDGLFDAEPDALIALCGDFNATEDEVPLEAIRGDVENTGNGDLAPRVLVPCERTVPEPARYSLLHQGRGQLLDHVLASRALLAFYRTTQIHNELLHDESVAFAIDRKFPESDHAPVVAEFVLPD